MQDKDGKFITTAGINHSKGLEIIASSAEKYDGHVRLNCDEEQFEIKVFLKVEQGK